MKSIALLIFIGYFSGSVTNSRHLKTKLFKIERSKDANQIFYDLHIDDDKTLNIDNPIDIYWVRKTEKNKVKPLTWIQQKFAYGLKYSFKNDSTAQFNFVSYDKKNFFLKKDVDNTFKVFTQINNHLVVVKKIYIHITGGTFWVPKIPKIELHAFDKKLNKNIIEIIKPT